MTPQEKNHQLTHSFFRQAFLLTMLQHEQKYFLKEAKHSGIKNCLQRMSQAISTNLLQIQTYLQPANQQLLNTTMRQSEEKIQAISTILEKLANSETHVVLEIEEQFNKQAQTA